jgi:predicted nucleic acid-binding protein
VADSYALLAAQVIRLGRQSRARVMDSLIAATAHAHKATVWADEMQRHLNPSSPVLPKTSCGSCGGRVYE